MNITEAVFDEVYDTEMSPTEIDELRDVLQSVLLESGKFDHRKIGEWLDGFDDCKCDEHRYGLISWAHTFIESGEEQDTQFEDILETDLLSASEKAELWSKIQNLDYHGRNLFMEYIERLLQTAKRQEREIIALGRSHDISIRQKNQIEKEFRAKKVDEREKMVKQLPTIVAEFKRKNKSERVIAKIHDLIDRRKILEARESLNSGVVVGDDYRRLEERISMIEADEVRDFLLAV